MRQKASTMNHPLYEELKRIAKAGEITHYGKIAPLADLDMGRPDHRTRMSELLAEISREEHTQGRPLLSVLVVQAEDGLPGVGFFTLAKELKLMRGGDQVTFFVQELKRVQAYWKNAAA